MEHGPTNLFDAVSWPHDSLRNTHEDGCTEPWIAEIVCSLLRATRKDYPEVVELGGFTGVTSAWLALTLKKMGGGSLTISEPDEARAMAIHNRLGALGDLVCQYEVSRIPSPQIIHSYTKGAIDFAFVDNDHTKLHVEQEICALWPKMTPGGIMCFHDIDPPCDLQTVVRRYGGIALHLPKLGPSGGLGILQVPL